MVYALISTLFNPVADMRDFSVFDEVVLNELQLHDTDCLECSTGVPDILNGQITTTEILSVFNDLPDGRAPGVDGIVRQFDTYNCT